MLTRIKNHALTGSVVVISSLGGVTAFAQDAATINVPKLVDPTNLASALTEAAGTWMLIGLGVGVGVSVFAVKLGWSFLKKFAGNA